MALGDTLRRARQERRISLNQAALETRIRQTLLEALEDNDYPSLPPRPFLRGLLRNYALYLHLDADTVLDDYDVETGAKTISAPPAPPEPEPLSPSTEFSRNPEPFPNPSQPSAEPFAFPPFPISVTPKTNGAAETKPTPALETVFHVAPEIESEVSPPTAPLNLSQEPPTLARRIGSTRIPEAIAILSLAVTLFVLVSVGMTAFQNLTLPFAAQPTAQPTVMPTATIPPGSTPTGIPMLAQTLEPTSAIIAIAPTEPFSATVAVSETALSETPTPEIPPEAQMMLTVEANGELGAWIIVDEDEVFNGFLKSETRTFTAHSRLFMQIKNIGNGRVFFQGTRILPRNQQERSELNRAWLMSPLGTPVIIPPTPYPSPVAPTEPPTQTPSATATSTLTLTSTRTLTPTLTGTPTITPSPTRTSTPTQTNTAAPTRTRTPTRCTPNPAVECE